MIYTNNERYLETMAVNVTLMGMAFVDQDDLYLFSNGQVLSNKLRMNLFSTGHNQGMIIN